MARFYKKRILVNVFGTFFYMVCLLQWLWALLPFLPQLIQFATTLQPEPTKSEPAQHIISTAPMSDLSIAIIIFITLTMIGVTVYALIKLPSGVGKAGSKLTHKASNYIVPVVSHHAKLSQKKRQWLTARIAIDIKLGLCMVPAVIVLFSYISQTSLPYDVSVFVCVILTVTALALLGIQLLLAKHFRVKPDQIW